MKTLTIKMSDEEYVAYIKAMGRHIARTGDVHTPDSFAELVLRKGVACLIETKQDKKITSM